MEIVESENCTIERDNSDLPPMDIPVIDLALLGSSSISGDELVILRSALASWGCFQVGETKTLFLNLSFFLFLTLGYFVHLMT